MSFQAHCLRCGCRTVQSVKTKSSSAICLNFAPSLSSLSPRNGCGVATGALDSRKDDRHLANTPTLCTVPLKRWPCRPRLSFVPVQIQAVALFHTSVTSWSSSQHNVDEPSPPPTESLHQPGKANKDIEDGEDVTEAGSNPVTSSASLSPPVSNAAPSADTPSPERTDSDDSLAVDSAEYEDSLVVHKSSTALPEVSFTLAPYVSKSVTLTSLVNLGVDLSEVEKVSEAAEHLVKSDFDADVKPYVLFLHDLGVDADKLGKVISRNPLIFQEHLDDLEVRVNYLRAKKFTAEAVAKLVTGAPLMLLMSVEKLDSKLGFLQSQFKLQGKQVREVVTKLPKLIIWHRQKLKDNRFYLKEFLGFSEAELTKILLTSPKVFISDKYAVGKKFDFLHNVVGISHAELTRWPHIFRTRLHLLQQRHRFLVSLGRAQYDSRLPNYVSLQALASGTDAEFCSSVAKASVTQFNNFLRTL